MIEKAMDEVDEMSSPPRSDHKPHHRLKKSLLKQLHSDVAAAYDAGKITRACAREFTHVVAAKGDPPSDGGYKDFSTTFARTQVVKTPAEHQESCEAQADTVEQDDAAEE